MDAHVVRWTWGDEAKMVEAINGESGLDLNYSKLDKPPIEVDFHLGMAAVLIWR